MSAKRTSMGVSVLAGLITAGVLGVILDVVEVPLGSVIGAFAGGLVAALVLHGRRSRAAIAGFLVGVFSFPVQLAIFITLISSGLYAPPPVPEIPEDVLLTALAAGIVMQVIAGALGGLLGGLFHRPLPEAVQAPRPYLPPPPPRPEKYCVQCGAGLAKQTMACPACGAKQPA